MEKQSSDDYSRLLAELSELFESEILHGDRDQLFNKTKSYWRMGQRIVQIVQRGDQQGGAYGKQTLRQLSADMTQKYGKGNGVGLRSLNYLRKFAVHYKIDQLNATLSWSHYQALLQIEDPAQRKQLEQRAVKEKLSRDVLKQLVSTMRRGRPGLVDKFPLTPRYGIENVYKVVQSVQPNDPRLVVDCGFGVLRRLNIRGVRGLSNNELLKLSKWERATGTARFSRFDCEPYERYCYRGTVTKVIDGDTVKMELQLGCDTLTMQTLRLRGVDAMELSTPEGITARSALVKMLRPAKTVHVLTYSYDRYKRYIADLIVDEHIYINKKLVENGHARFLKM